MKNNVTEFDLKAAFKALDELEIPAAVKRTNANLNESIRKQANTDCLLEDYYDVNDKKDLEQAADDRNDEIAKAKLARIEKIVDLDAKSPEDLQPSYVGKNIIQCPQCMNLFYKNPDEIEKSEEDPTLVNVGEKCQHCGNENGYTLIGKVGEVSEDERDNYEAPENELDVDFNEPTKEVDNGKAPEIKDEKDELDLNFEEPTKDVDELDLDFEEKEDEEKKDEKEEKKEESFTKVDATPLNEEVPAETNKPELNETKEESGLKETLTEAKIESGICESGESGCESGIESGLAEALKEAICPVCGKEIESGESGCESGKCESGIIESLNEELNKALNESKAESGKEESGEPVNINVKEKVELPNYDVKVEQKKDKVKVEVKPIKENLEEGCKKDKKEKKAEELKEEAENKKAEDLSKKLKDWNEYIEYVRGQIKAHEEAYKKCDNEFVKAAIQKTIDGCKADLEKALPEQLKAENALNAIPNPDDIKNEALTEGKKEVCPKCGKEPCECDKKKAVNEEVINKDPKNAVVPCKVNKVIAHSEDEKPVDCLGEKKPLDKPLTEASVKEELEAFVANMDLKEDLDKNVNQKEFNQVFDVVTGDKKIGEAIDSEMKKHLEVAKDFKDKVTNEDISEKEVANKLRDFKVVFESITDINEKRLSESINESLINVYSNVKEFKLESCKLNDDKFIVEGVIEFNSGNKKNTKYVFTEATVKDKILNLVGLNEDLSDNKKAFNLTCAIEDNGKCLVTESLAYNYKIGENLVEGLIK